MKINKKDIPGFKRFLGADKILCYPEKNLTIIKGILSEKSLEKPGKIGESFLRKCEKKTKFSLLSEFKLYKTKVDSAGNKNLFYHQYYNGLRVYPGRASIFIDSTGKVKRIKIRRIDNIKVSVKSVEPKIGFGNVFTKLEVSAKLNKSSRISAKPELLVYSHSKKDGMSKPVLAWNIPMMRGRNEDMGYIIDANSGQILDSYSDRDEAGTTTTGIGINASDETALSPTRNLDVEDPGGGADLQLFDSTRTVDIKTYDMEGSTDEDAAYDLCEDDDGDGVFNDITQSPNRRSSNRPEVDGHYNTGLVADYYLKNRTVNGINLFNRDGWKGDGTEDWISYIHYDVDSQSSYYSRSKKKIFHGDGDGTNLSFKPGLDTCAHEWHHAVQATEITGGASAYGGFDSAVDETFVIKETLADVFAGCTNRDGGWRLGEMQTDDVAMAAATFSNTGARYRSLKTPSVSDSPDHYYADGCTLGYGWAGAPGASTTEKNYRRIGILNKAAYLMAMGGSHPSAAADPATYPPVYVKGFGANILENILYYALTMLMEHDELFADYRDNVLLACDTLYPASPCYHTTIENAFNAVGVYESGSTPPAAPSGPNPQITPWGSQFGTSPYWKSPDVYCEDAGGAEVNPEKGIVNTLCATVRNVGDTAANNTSVSFYFSPYGLGYHHEDFKLIGTATVNLPADGSEVEASVAWDLTDLTDDYGGLWPYPISDFDHFCVMVELSHPDDTDDCNNSTQHNFCNVELSDADGDGLQTAILISNPSQKTLIGSMLIDQLTAKEIKFGIKNKEVLSLNSHLLREKEMLSLKAPSSVKKGLPVAFTPREKRKMEITIVNSKKNGYHGEVSGEFKATEIRGKKGKMQGTIKWLDIEFGAERAEFKAKIEAFVFLGKEMKAGKKTRLIGQRFSSQGEIAGKVERKTGEFEGNFSGISLVKDKSVKFSLKGKMKASSLVSLSLDFEDMETQGLDLQLRIIG